MEGLDPTGFQHRCWGRVVNGSAGAGAVGQIPAALIPPTTQPGVFWGQFCPGSGRPLPLRFCFASSLLVCTVPALVTKLSFL